MPGLPQPICTGCNKTPAELDCYDTYLEPGQTADEYVRQEEGTYNSVNGHFLCDPCYIAAGCPSNPGGWVAP